MNKTFQKYYFSVLISNLGNACTTFLFPIYILELTKSTFQLSIISAMELIPFLIFGLPFGVIIDKVNIKKLMQICDFIRFVNYSILFLLVVLNQKSLIVPYIYICAAISGLCYVFHTISESTLVPNIVKKEELTKANSLIFGVQYVTNFLVPIISGILYSKSIIGYFFLFDGFSFLLSFIVLGLIRMDEAIEKRKLWVKLHFMDLGKEIKEGFLLLKKDRSLFKMLLVVAASNLIIASYYNGLLDYMKNDLLLSTKTIGFIEGMYSLGALVGSLMTNMLIKKMSGFKIVIICIGVDALCRLLMPLNQSAYMIAGLMVIIELTSAVLNIMIITIRQERVDNQYLGRINSLFKTVLLGINPMGLIIGGYILEEIGSLNNMIVISILCTVLFAISMVVFRTEKKH